MPSASRWAKRANLDKLIQRNPLRLKAAWHGMTLALSMAAMLPDALESIALPARSSHAPARSKCALGQATQRRQASKLALSAPYMICASLSPTLVTPKRDTRTRTHAEKQTPRTGAYCKAHVIMRRDAIATAMYPVTLAAHVVRADSVGYPGWESYFMQRPLSLELLRKWDDNDKCPSHVAVVNGLSKTEVGWNLAVRRGYINTTRCATTLWLQFPTHSLIACGLFHGGITRECLANVAGQRFNRQPVTTTKSEVIAKCRRRPCVGTTVSLVAYCFSNPPSGAWYSL